MPASTLKPGTANELLRTFGMLTSSIGESLGSLVGREIVVRPGEPEVHEAAAFLAALPPWPMTVSRGVMDKAFAGKTLHVAIELPDAVAMAGLLMMTADDVISERRQSGALTDDDATAFGELGTVMFAGFANVLRECVENCEVRYQDYVVTKPGEDKPDTFGSGTLVAFAFRLKLGEYPESRGYVLLDATTAETWNKSPLTIVAEGAPARPGSRTDEESLESIPAAPIRGTLAAFVMQPEVFRTLRLSCRRVGLDMRRHGRGEIPNPAAHRNEIVLMDVPPGEDRRFDWCRRIKELSDSTRVVLLIHHPSRHRVMQAYMARADAIIGYPCGEAQMSQKLGAMLDHQPSEPPIP